MTLERSKRRDLLSLIFITKSISKKLLIKIMIIITIIVTVTIIIITTGKLSCGTRIADPVEIWTYWF